jgi:hypothetical protein
MRRHRREATPPPPRSAPAPRPPAVRCSHAPPWHPARTSHAASHARPWLARDGADTGGSSLKRHARRCTLLLVVRPFCTCCVWIADGPHAIRVRVEIMGSQKCGIVGKSQPVLTVINPIIFTRTRMGERPVSERGRRAPRRALPSHPRATGVCYSYGCGWR